MAASIYSQSGQIILDNSGRVAPGALLYFFEGGTTTPLDTFSNSDLTAERTHPVEADGNGRVPAIYLSYVSFDVKVTTSGGTQLYYHTDISNPEPFDDVSDFDTTTVLGTGDIFAAVVNSSRQGAVRLNGRTIGNASSSATERANDDTTNLFAYLWNNLANAQAAVSGGRGASAAVDFAANKRITLPDFRGASLVGFDDMGSTAASLLGSAPVVLGGTTTSGSILGANTHTITTAQVPSHTHTFSGTTGFISADHTHTYSGSNNTGTVSNDHTHNFSTTSDGSHSHSVSGGTVGGTAAVGTDIGAGAAPMPVGTGTITIDANGSHTHSGTTGGINSNHFHAFSWSGTTGGVSSNHTHDYSGTTSTGSGSGAAHNILSRSGLVTWFIKL